MPVTAEKLQSKGNGLEKTRRNFFLIGAIAASAALAKIERARAFNGSDCGRHPDNPHCCFLKGTRIQTADGPRRVEDLAIGDLLPTKFGGVRPIQWIGKYPYRKSDPSKPWAKAVRPVRIARSAIEQNVPHADLYVTRAHALYIDGILVPAGSLINDTTIQLCGGYEHDELEFYHVKLETHDVIYAEGAEVETLLRVDEAAVNFADYLRRYGSAVKEETTCAPLILNGARQEIKSRLRSAISPWYDLRNHADVIRDQLEHRGMALCDQED
jgi:hypothetical protein